MESRQKSVFSAALIIYIIGGAVVLLLAGAAIYFYIQYQNIKKNPNQVTKAETEALVSQVGKLIDLPKDETPTIATILDKEKLKDQPFFNNAKNGDKILIYTKAKKAIIYRPSENKLINVGPIAIDQKAQIPVTIVNAGGDISAAQKTLNDKFSGGIAITTTDAKNKNSVKQVTVVDVSGNNADAAKQIAEALGGIVASSIPSGEPTPSGASIVVFVK